MRLAVPVSGAKSALEKAKQIRCINQAKRGMLALNVGWLGMGQLRTSGFNHSRMNQLDLCGTSGVAPFYLMMSRALDLLIALENTDPKRVAVTGLSTSAPMRVFRWPDRATGCDGVMCTLAAPTSS